ncbi:TPA: 50S ribosomal protein L19e [Candidatus Geothermarchaeota archaeon]|nr:50S ribosomal protein L19e [Candidatus Geothermarchaeota archaeon]HIQ12922.1 50S ribosomal protein L19e [Thermoprotei archaeon]
MVNVKNKRRLIARYLGVGIDRVWIDPEAVDEVMDIDTREDVMILIRRGIVKVKNISGQQHRIRKRKRGPGSRKGPKTSRMSKKELWMQRVRAQRKFLRYLRDKGLLTRKQYRLLYRRVKGGMFRSKAHLLDYIKETIWR